MWLAEEGSGHVVCGHQEHVVVGCQVQLCACGAGKPGRGAGNGASDSLTHLKAAGCGGQESSSVSKGHS